MIKITKPGKNLPETETIYTITCPYCECEFECKVGDFAYSERTPNGDRLIFCPCCKRGLHTKTLKDIVTREEPIKDPKPDLNCFDYSPKDDVCNLCPHQGGPKDIFGNPTAGDSMCEWCPHYKWKVTYCDTNIANCNTLATSTSFVMEDLKDVSK